MRINLKIIITFILVVAAALWTKFIAQQEIQVGEVKEIIPGFFNLILTYNPGAAFGFMADLPENIRPYALAVTTLIALAAVFYFFFKDPVCKVLSCGDFRWSCWKYY